MRRSRVLITVLGFLIVAGAIAMQLSHPPELKAQKGCTNQTLRGTYGFHAQGWFYQDGPGSLRVPAAQIGTLHFDGAGNVILFATASVDGDVDTFGPVPYTYQVNPSCTGSISPAGSGGPGDFVLVDSGKQLFLIGTSTMVWSGTAIRQ